MLVIFSGLPGTGKTKIARALAKEIGAVHLRIDTIEQALRDKGLTVVDGGYRVAYAVAEDNLRLGLTVIADSVNPIQLTRDAWHAVANRAGTAFLDVELICSDKAEHRRRVEQRQADIAGHNLPTWIDVEAREYDRWDRDRVVIDTAIATPGDAVTSICAALGGT